MKIHCTNQFLRAAALLAAIIYSGNFLAQAQSCSVTWTGNAGRRVEHGRQLEPAQGARPDERRLHPDPHDG